MDREQAKDYIKGELESYLTSKGINPRKPFKCLNPAHPDNNPSMSYDTKRNKAHCFSCGADYDTLDIIGIDYGIADNGEIFKKAYELFGIDGGQRATERTHNSIHTYTQPPEQEVDYTKFYREAHQHIKETDYPQRRGLSEETINRFNLGYVEGWKLPLEVYLKGGGGLTANGKPRTKESWESLPPSPRLIIPTSPQSYLARDTRAELTEKQEKYSKSKVGAVRIFNSKALKTADRPIFITEGELDALSIIEVGGEAIATGSTANRRALLELLKSQKPTQPLIIALDNDEAGDKAAQELTEGLRELNIPFYRLNPYGECKDANEALQADRKAFRAAIEEAEHIEDETKEAEREAYLRTSTAHHLQSFINGIADSVNTPFISTGFNKLDEVLDGGLYEGLYTVGAISSLGKTTLITQIADNIAKSGNDVLIFSLEMARAELMAKSISRHTLEIVLESGGSVRDAKTTRGITTGILYAQYSQTERELIKAATRAYGEYAEHIFISEGIGDIGTAQVLEAVQKHISFTGRTPTIIIDYLQILAPYSERMTDKQNTDKAVLELKRISRDYKTPIIAISSFNRNSYKNDEVTMEAFKESGAIEYSSDVLIGLQLKSENKESTDREVELVILKNRNGKKGSKLTYTYSPRFNYFKES
jgi:replicative DNA helicase